jgi:hypothetical protein
MDMTFLAFVPGVWGITLCESMHILTSLNRYSILSHLNHHSPGLPSSRWTNYSGWSRPKRTGQNIDSQFQGFVSHPPCVCIALSGFYSTASRRWSRFLHVRGRALYIARIDQLRSKTESIPVNTVCQVDVSSIFPSLPYTPFFVEQRWSAHPRSERLKI